MLIKKGMEIKPYQEMIKIRLYQWEDIITTISIDELFGFLNSWIKFMKLDWKIINTNDIRIAEPYKIDDIENYILSQPKDVQVFLRRKQKEQPISFERFSYVQYQVKVFYWEDKENYIKKEYIGLTEEER